MSSQKKKKHPNLNFKEENSSRFYSWGLQCTVVLKSLFDSVLPCLLFFFFFFFFFFCRYQTSPFPPLTSASVRRKVLSPLLGDDSGVVIWPVDTFMSVELLTGWVWHESGRRGPLLNPPGNLSWTAKISLLDPLI